MNDSKRLGRLIVVRERLLSVRRSELAQASAALVRAQEDAVRVASELDDTVQALMNVGDALPEELALRATTVRAAVEGVRRADSACAERAAERAEHAERAVEAKRDVRVLEELETRLANVERRAEARREQATTDETAARTRGTV
jgi:flagellar export protein FliJ